MASLVSPRVEDIPSSSTTSIVKFSSLPTELRLKIWSRAVEPRIVLFGDLASKHRSYPLPSVTQLTVEARTETRQGYEPIGNGSYFDFARDILVCDHKISDQAPDPFLEEIAPRIKRLAYWDCFPDDGRVDGPYHYSVYLSACYRQRDFGTIEFDRFWFPNLKDLWIVKVGEVDPTWMVNVDRKAPYDVRLRELAKQFRYWVDENVIEMAPLDLNDPEVKAILTEGRCGKEDCHELNEGRTKMISKVVFLDGKYEAPTDGIKWVRILPWHVDEQIKEKKTYENRLRWVLVERILTFDLRWEPWSDLDSETANHGRGIGS
ncbi:Fc.00g037730.m01.CDS01 [Cosmosporella sp. VM-42]